MIRSLLVRGMLVGALAGLLAFPFAHHFGEPRVQQAINFEDEIAQRDHEPPGEEVVSRGTQRSVGLATGTIVMGVALGGLFSLLFAWAYGRVGPWGSRGTAAMLALAAYVTVTLVPFTKYPPNPPSVGNPDTIDKRTVLFIAMIAIAVLALIAASRVRRQLLAQLGSWNAAIAAGVVFVAVVAVGQLILPGVHEVPAGFPSETLWGYRVASLGINGVLWLTIGLGFGVAAERVLAARAPQGATVPAGA